MGFSEKVIVEFLLEKKNVQVAQQTFSQFIRSRSRSSSLKNTNAVEVATTTQPLQTETEITENQKQPISQKTHPKLKKGLKNLIGKMRLLTA